jgi:hypothetical protein
MTYLERQKNYGPDKLCWEEAEEEEEEEAEEKIRLKQYVSLRLKGRHKYLYSNNLNNFWEETNVKCLGYKLLWHHLKWT